MATATWCGRLTKRHEVVPSGDGVKLLFTVGGDGAPSIEVQIPLSDIARWFSLCHDLRRCPPEMESLVIEHYNGH